MLEHELSLSPEKRERCTGSTQHPHRHELVAKFLDASASSRAA